jgi:hypothetical protein
MMPRVGKRRGAAPVATRESAADRRFDRDRDRDTVPANGTTTTTRAGTLEDRR